VLKDKPVGRKIGLAEHRVLSVSQEKKKHFVTFERRGRQLRRTTRMS